ncbi:MAG: S-methyl-5'-thioadenosine phosphorylase [Actinobacteria bacterium]|nr:S-methyl-5'-thioadenosine phosphorylase [Actinomycetota bacterium]
MDNENKTLIGITGGTGIYEIPGLHIIEEIAVETPFGDPSDLYFRGVLEGVEVIFHPRHGRGHRYPAPGINFRANIYGFKALGVDTLISISAVGSMKEKYRPRDIVIPDQFYDNTKRRANSFFTGSPAVHVNFADPVCPVLSEALYESCKKAGVTVHMGGTYICIEGPAFSTRAESKIYRSWGIDIIGMTGATEAKLCREAEICYTPLALVTDYDVWKEDEEDVTGDLIIENLMKNADAAREIVKDVIKRIPRERDCICREALGGAIVTAREMMHEGTLRELRVLVDKWIPME